ncbi:tyrosine-type recombinase/integrase [Comamonas suwonensis]|uniref:Integrase arm-type DNA-binding domain-containing protein n=1 Tax=Comamonas suwonensis TaxID=2606214 RepID=A0A843BGV1_9BURK|nr:integrase arm-type DNA-binding domain-containing protein [Comamonas suwonensis]MBI1626848.1 integrase arm-type DNA-binding domain-containing protein [Comamonas suwonensis]
MLTDAQCRNATCSPGAKRERFSDSGGLYLEVSPAGSRRWFWKYRKDGKEGRLALGSYPQVSLSAARKARDIARLQKSEGIDPAKARKVEKLVNPTGFDNSFKSVALEWHGRQVTRWSPGHAERTLRQLERDLFPWIGDREMSQIQPMELLAVLQKVEERGAIETADRALMLARQVWRYWLPTASNTQRDITEGLKARLTPYRGSNFPAIVEPERFGELLRAMYAYKGGPFVRTALLLAPLLYQRPANLRMMEWEELDLDGQMWTIPSAKMKRSVQEKENGEPHVVPLPKQAVAMLRELKPLSGRGRYVFPGQRDHDRPMSDNSVRTALYSLGFGDEQSWHGFRASARTMLVDQLDLDPLAIEANLAHAVKDANGRSYNRTKYLAKRFDQIQQWADYLDHLRESLGVVEGVKKMRVALNQG